MNNILGNTLMKKYLTIFICTILSILLLNSCGDLTTPMNAISGNLGGLVGNTSDSSGGYVTSLITKNTWDEFFPGRWGVGEHWEFIYQTYYSHFYNPTTMKYDLYSYDNFKAAVEELSYIQIKIVPKEYDYKQIYRFDSRDSKGWVYIGASTSWTQLGDTEEQLVNFGHFINKPNTSNEDKNRELAAFLANISHETGEPTADQTDNYGLFYREEVGMEGTDNIGYRQEENVEYPPADGKSYHGRGPIQLSYNYNYGPASVFIYGDKNVLLSEPELVMTDGKVAFMTAIWFWMVPQSPKPSCHEVMYSDFVASSGQLDCWGFGHSVMVINGGVEGNGNMKERRGVFYEKFANILGISIGINGEKINTDGLNPY